VCVRVCMCLSLFVHVRTRSTEGDVNANKMPARRIANHDTICSNMKMSHGICVNASCRAVEAVFTYVMPILTNALRRTFTEKNMHLEKTDQNIYARRHTHAGTHTQAHTHTSERTARTKMTIRTGGKSQKSAKQSFYMVYSVAS